MLNPLHVLFMASAWTRSYVWYQIYNIVFILSEQNCFIDIRFNILHCGENKWKSFSKKCYILRRIQNKIKNEISYLSTNIIKKKPMHVCLFVCLLVGRNHWRCRTAFQNKYGKMVVTGLLQHKVNMMSILVAPRKWMNKKFQKLRFL